MTTQSQNCAVLSAAVGIAPKYIDIDSTFRNRELYPNPTEFIVGGSCQQYEDPIVDGLPVHMFKGSMFNLSNVLITGGTSSLPQLNTAVTSTENGFYVGGKIVNTRTNSTSIITGYDGQTHFVQTLSPMDFVPDNDLCNVVDPSTRKFIMIPSTNYIVVPNPDSNIQPYHQINFVNNSNYVGMYLINRTIGETRQIINYNTTTQLAEVDSDFGPTWSTTDEYEIKTNIATIYTANNVNIVSGRFHVNPSTVHTDLVGHYLRVIEPVTSQNYDFKVAVDRIVGYNKLTGTITTTYGSYLDEVGVSIEVLPITRGNANNIPMTPACRLEHGLYEIQLLGITLPNAPILGTNSLYLSNYPYFYVEFGNKHSSSQHQVLSNNPHASKALFKIPVYDLPSPAISPFIRLSTGMRHIIPFNPHDEYRVRIYLPNGSLVTYKADSVSPFAPNEYLQVSLTLSVVRVKP